MTTPLPIRETCPVWMKWTLRAAAIYNAAWGIFMMAFPNAWWDWIGQPRPNHEFLWAGLGSLILLFGAGYWIASYDPARHWGLVALGLASKVLGFLGTAVGCFIQKNVPIEFFWSAIANDLVWWVPFVLIVRWGIRTNR
ncbi:MAG: alkyl hydroperoxide reductase [Phycisphaerae bacterium]|nr:alkyl hydroperoxide reductase [Phycisphaerae bacterium]